jgi:hypothetical protein
MPAGNLTLNALVGTRCQVINGYGTVESMLAVERGEVDGMCGASWSTPKALVQRAAEFNGSGGP